MISRIFTKMRQPSPLPLKPSVTARSTKIAMRSVSVFIEYCHEYFHRARLLKRIPKDIALLFDLDEEMQEQEILSTPIEVGYRLFHPYATNYGRHKP
jgi:hypothetical protein